MIRVFYTTVASACVSAYPHTEGHTRNLARLKSL